MALHAVAVGTEVAPTRPPGLRTAAVTPGTATIATLAAPTRAATVARRRHERRRLLLVGAVVFGAPVVACLGILEVVR